MSDASSNDSQLQSDKSDQLEKALWDTHPTQSMLAATIESTASGVVVADLNIDFILVNPAGENLLGKIAKVGPDQWNESLGLFKSEEGPLFEEHELPLYRAVRGEVVTRMELLVRNGVDEEPIWLEANATQILGLNKEPLGAVSVFNDITGKKISQQDARQAMVRVERLASIGTLAAGLAHEINNPLGAMILTSELAKMRLANGELTDAQIEEVLNEFNEQIERCAKIVKGVQKFAGSESTERKVCSLHHIALESKNLIQYQATKRQIEIQIRETGCADTFVNVNESEIEQVFVSLLSNAIDASPDGSTIEIDVRTVGDRVVCSVIDNGSGMSEEEKIAVFDPFHTSKRQAGGTGLGLSLSHTIVASHGGELWIEESEREKGTTFSFKLPIASASSTLD